MNPQTAAFNNPQQKGLTKMNESLNKPDMTTSELFKKHFGDTGGVVGIFHPHLSGFFNELNEICKQEDIDKAKDEPIEITFSQAVHANDEISAKEKFEEHELIEEENERMMERADRGGFENG